MSEELGQGYWAGRQGEDFPREAYKRIVSFFSHVRWSGFLGIYQAAHRAAYAGYHTGGEIQKVGKDLRFRKIEANEFRNLMLHTLNMVTGQRLHFDAQAQTTDSSAQEQTLVANGLAETCVREKGLEAVRLKVAESRCLYGEGWGLGLWDDDEGEEFTTDVDPVTGAEKPLYTGDVVFRSKHPLDVARDCQRIDPEGMRWAIVREYENKWDLADRFPKFADEILRLPTMEQEDQKYPRIIQYRNRPDDAGSDEIPIWYLYHDKCPALRDGRFSMLASETLVLQDEALPYRELPVHRSAGMNLDGTVFGYSLFWDLLPLTQALNGALSAIITRMSALGVPNIWMPAGAPLQKTKVGEGLNILEGGTQPPQLVDLGKLTPEQFSLIELIRNLFATYSGINDVARGMKPDGVSAASALALLEARAMQFVALDQKADVSFMEQITTGGLHNYQDRGVVPYLVKLTGKGNRYSVREFVGNAESLPADRKQVASVEKVTGFSIRIGNPLQETNAGRMQMADALAQNGMLKKPDDYIQVVTTGRLEPALEATTRAELAIVAENEALARGETVIVGAFDNPVTHIPEHWSVAAPPEARKDAKIVQAVTDHVAEHIAIWRAMDPAVMQLMGIPPAPPLGMPMVAPSIAPPGAPGATDTTQPPAPGDPTVMGPDAPGPAAEAARVMPAQPAANPMTGEPNGAPAVV